MSTSTAFLPGPAQRSVLGYGATPQQIPFAFFELTDQEQAVLNQLAQARAMKRSATAVKFVRQASVKLPEQLDILQALACLEEPFWNFEAQRAEKENTEPVRPAFDRKIEVEDSFSANGQEWTDTIIARLHGEVLDHALGILAKKGLPRKKLQELMWIFKPPALQAVIKEGDCEISIPVPQALIPFSFERACRMEGYDPEILREGIARSLVNRGLAPALHELGVL